MSRSFTPTTAAWRASRRPLRPTTVWPAGPVRPCTRRARMPAASAGSATKTAPPSPQPPRGLVGKKLVTPTVTPDAAPGQQERPPAGETAPNDWAPSSMSAIGRRRPPSPPPARVGGKRRRGLPAGRARRRPPKERHGNDRPGGRGEGPRQRVGRRWYVPASMSAHTGVAPTRETASAVEIQDVGG
eukprot:TRINITY_DN6631_c0_g1_i1.p2 TRINITY_DN6631_c0_g1~~TRINITY_DN6631_c0_g1_i1.p2  ORF type:complete len:186 (+),score=21.16 TRINITY_DN6631_c0_g1_i1:438-995(+)